MRFSRLMLGTAQFGQAYGVANRSGAPDFSAVCAMLTEAAAAGVNCLDTAFAYGESESTLGRALRETGLRTLFHLVTKTDSRLPDNLSAAATERRIRVSVEESLRRLQAETVAVVLLHRDTYPAGLDALAKLCDGGLIGTGGVSVGSVTNARAFESHPDLGAVQAPVNVLDRRFESFLGGVRKRGGLVFARSCYLQGLLLMWDAATPEHLLPVRSSREYFRQLSQRFGMSLPELLLRAMWRRPEIDSVVVGAENLTQLRENLKIFARAPLSEDVGRRIDEFVYEGPAWILDPPQWAVQTRGSPGLCKV